MLWGLLVRKSQMLLAAEVFPARSHALASGQVNAADFAANHVFGLYRRPWRGCGSASATADEQIDNDEDSDEKEELCHAFFTTS